MRPSRMTSLHSWIVSLMRTRASTPPAHASGAHSAAGRPSRMTSGLVAAGTSGTRSIRVECALPAFISGLKPNASRAVEGRHIRSGMGSESGQMLTRTIEIARLGASLDTG